MNKSLNEKIVILFNKGYSYNKIAKEVGCSKSSVSYHCSKLRTKNNDYTFDKIETYQIFYNSCFSLKFTAESFNLNSNTLAKYITQRRLTKEERESRAITNRKDYRKIVKIKAVEYKGNRCILCGYDKCIQSLDFHHKDPKEKEFQISGGTKSFEKMKIELDKCVLVCKNCHGEIHAGLKTIL